MNKLLIVLGLLLGFTFTSVAQEKSNIAESMGEKALVASKTSDVFTFVLPTVLTKSEVEKRASYYTSSISVAFNESNNSVAITVVGTDKKSKYIIARFLTACGASYVKVDDKELNMADFISAYLN